MLSPCETKFRVSIFDLDLNFHMNNGRYFSIMDLGRLDLMLKTKNFFRVFLKGYYPLVLSESMNFRKSLGLFQKYSVITKVDSWDKKFFYFTQDFIVQNKTCSTSSVRVCFKQRGRKGIVPTQELLEFFKVNMTQKDISKLALKHIDLDNSLNPRD